MHQQAKLLFLFMFLWLVSKAQGQNGKRTENTVLKLDKGENPYSKRKSAWLVKNGFDVDVYDWQNKEINQQLKGAFDQRTSAYVWGVVGLASAVQLGNQMINNDEGRGFWFTASVTSGVIASIQSFKAKKRVKQVNIWHQNLDSVNQDSVSALSIHKHYHLPSPYKPSKNKYLLKNDFDLYAYHWDNEEINLQLDKAFELRSTGQVLLGVSLGSFFLGALYKLAGMLADENDKGGSAGRIGTGLYIASGAMVTGSIVLTSLAQGKVRKAEQQRILLSTQ
ncbi:hypothetical protein N7E81_11890 [Reichenbachiella carrageenanivorans]|uniref:DUF5683 domain-containing protein n=1 Tax=Reichenbachiella carrageenanivorans TaxID=2979869 RepID=A0ABY6CVW9_9BACT|nr:hypothetical protein [Reichenbachiella carrageenanivorans]UXX78059.1 hypothetical protein N7E81_11890 [Reichenbachiella carrageenanivorans]